MYRVVNLCPFEYVALIWEDLVDIVKRKKKEKIILFVRYIKLHIRALMNVHQISAIPDERAIEEKFM